MSNKKNAPISAGTPIGAEEKGSRKAIPISNSNSNIKRKNNQACLIAPLLSEGQDAAVSIKPLMTLTGLENREVRRLIYQERLRGVPILSNNVAGYFLPGNEQERSACVNSLRRRAMAILRVAAAIEQGEEKKGGINR